MHHPVNVRPQGLDNLPPVGSWITNGARMGQVVEHVIRPGRPPLARVQFRDGFGTYQAHEIHDAGV